MRQRASLQPIFRSVRKPAPVGCAIDWTDTINNGLVNCWLFNEASGRLLVDRVRSKNGTFTNAPTWVGGPLGACLNFASASSQTVIAQAIPTMANPWTISGWVSWTTLTNLAGGFGFNNTTNGVCVATDGTHLKIASNGETPGNGATLLSTNTLYNVAMYWDNTKIFTYLNGVSEYSVTPTGNNWKSATQTQFGKNAPGATFLNGKVDIVRVHSRVLSPSEIMRLYVEPFAGVLSARSRLWDAVGVAAVAGSNDDERHYPRGNVRGFTRGAA